MEYTRPYPAISTDLDREREKGEIGKRNHACFS